MGVGDELKNLSELHAQGTLTDSEFEAAKRKVLEADQHDPAAHPSASFHHSPIRQRTNGLAIAALVLGLIGMGVGHILALIFGYRAKRQIDASPDEQRGRGLAVAGIVLGWVGVGALVTLGGLAIYMTVWGGGIDFSGSLATRAATVDELKEAVEKDAGVGCVRWSEFGLNGTGSTCALLEDDGGPEYWIHISLVPDGASPGSVVEEQFSKQSVDDGYFVPPEICYVVTPHWVMSTGAPSVASKLVQGIGGELECRNT